MKRPEPTSRSVRLGGFVLQEPIGVGGNGEVWRAMQVGTRALVAIKVMTSERARHPRYREAFATEVRAVAGLDHPGIVRVLEVGTVDADTERVTRGRIVAGSPFLAMELAQNGSLRTAPPPRSFDALRLRLLWLLESLGHAHAHGVVHRDLKPGNILVFGRAAVEGDADGASRLRLADFGLAHPMDRTDFDVRERAGTPAYMAPEQFRGQWRRFGPATDLYALGCVAWTLASGRPPFGSRDVAGLMHAHLSVAVAPLVPRFPVPDGFDEWLHTLLRKRPLDRFQRAADAAYALVQLGEANGESGSDPWVTADLPTWTPPSAIVSGSETADSRTWSSQTLPESSDDVDTLEFGIRLESDEVQPERPGLRRELPPLPARWQRPFRVARGSALSGAGLNLYGIRPVPLVGRTEERDALWAALQRVRATNELEVVVLEGPAGTGKSRLARWLAARADALGSAVVARAVHSPGGGVSDGLAELCRRLTRSIGLSGPALERHLDLWHRERKSSMTPGSFAWLDPSADDSTRSAVERHHQVLSLLRCASRGLDDHARPVVVWLDDVQWGEDALGFVRTLLDDSTRDRFPLLVVTTVLTESTAIEPAVHRRLTAIRDDERSVVCKIGPMKGPERRALVEELLVLDQAVADQVVERSQGIPLFAVLLVEDWVRRGVLREGGNGLELQAGDEAPIPDTIHQLWAARLKRHTEADPRALEVASLLGAMVDEAEWEAACQVLGVDVPEDTVERAIEHQLVERTEAGWTFAHGLLRESLRRRSLEHGRLRALHEACAVCLQIRWRAHPRPGLARRVGRHFVLAGQVQRALQPLLDAAKQARGSSDYGTAVDLLDARDRLLDQLGAESTDPRRGAGWVARADALVCMGRLVEAEKVANQVVSVGRRQGWEAQMAPALRLAAIAVGKRGRFDAARRRLQRAIDAARYGGDPSEGARSRLFLGDVERMCGALEEASSHYRSTLRKFRDLADVRGEAESLIGLAAVSVSLGESEDAARYAAAARERFERVGARFGAASSLNLEGDLARRRGDFDAARAAYRGAEQSLRALGSPEVRIPVLNLALLSLDEGDGRGAIDRLGPLHAGMLADRRVAFQMVCALALVWAHLLSGRPEAAQRWWGAVVTGLDDTGLVDNDVVHLAEGAAAAASEPLRSQLLSLAASQRMELAGR